MEKAILASNEEIRLETSRYLQTLKNLGLDGGELSEIQMCLEQYTGCAYTLEKRSDNNGEASTEKFSSCGFRLTGSKITEMPNPDFSSQSPQPDIIIISPGCGDTAMMKQFINAVKLT